MIYLGFAIGVVVCLAVRWFTRTEWWRLLTWRGGG